MLSLVLTALLSQSVASPVPEQLSEGKPNKTSPMSMYKFSTNIDQLSVQTGYVAWKKEQILKNNETLENSGRHCRRPDGNALYARGSYSVYGQGQNVPIDAPGLAAYPAYKGFPSRGSAPAQTGFIEATLYSFLTPGLVPEGVNPPQCTPKEGHVPVILIPGTVETAYSTWAYMGPKLVDEDLCVYTFNHNPLSALFDTLTLDSTAFMGDIIDSAAALDKFIDEVLEITGAEKVDFVGHSQGAGALPYYYLKNVMVGTKVRKTIGLAPSLGTEFYGIDSLFSLLHREIWEFDLKTLVFGHGFNSASLDQQLTGSEFMRDLNNGGPAIEGVEYINVATIYDNLLMPWQRCLPEPLKGQNITNIVLQDICSEDKSDHQAFPYSRNAYQIIRNHLLDTHDAITCYSEKPVIPFSL